MCLCKLVKVNQHQMRTLQCWVCRCFLWSDIWPWKKIRIPAVHEGGGWKMASRQKKPVVRCLHTIVPWLMSLFYENSITPGSGTFCTRAPEIPTVPDATKVLSSVLLLFFFIGSWNTTDMVPKPTKCCKRISASLGLSIGVMKMASKQGNAC